MTLNMKSPRVMGYTANVPIALYLLKLRKLLSGHMYGRILSLRKVYDLATENIRSLDFEPIR